MGKTKNRKNRDDTTSQSSRKNKQSATQKSHDDGGNTAAGASSSAKNSTDASASSFRRRSLYTWCVQERQGIVWVMGCAILGGMLGFGIGAGYLTGEMEAAGATPWRISLASFLRGTMVYQFLFVRLNPTSVLPIETMSNAWGTMKETLQIGTKDSARKHDGDDNDDTNVEPFDLMNSDPSDPMTFAILREAVIREKGGYVYPDLGLMLPAPCGAARGLGMVRDSYYKCQIDCMPGLAAEKLEERKNDRLDPMRDGMRPSVHEMKRQQEIERPGKQLFKQEEVLVKVPLSYQMTRSLALETLLPRVSAEVQRKANLHELDDAALLVLLLAHERGVGRFSRWTPYIATMPKKPSCGYTKEARPFMLDSIKALKDEFGLDIFGWHEELVKAEQYADRIANMLTRDYSPFIQHPKGISPLENIQWSLCQVASRATGGSQKHGSLRMVPVIDLINHDANAGGFVELTGKERFEDGDFVDASEEDSGAFVVRSLRHGRRKALRKGQELLASYNVPHYSSLDWFVSLGFVPPERWSRWQKIDAALPRIRKDGPFAEEPINTAELWKGFSVEF